MTTDQRTPELTAMEAAQLDSFEAAAYAEDALRERMARAIQSEWRAHGGWIMHDGAARGLADAALAVVRTPVEAER